MSDPRRVAIIAEAESWLRTPFHHQGRIKGVGTDCLMLLAEVYERAGVIAHVEPPYYPRDWHLHRDAERYLDGVMGLAREIAGPPEPGDVALFKMGRCFAHGAIVVIWPRVIHAYWAAHAVVQGDATRHPLADRPVRFFTVF